MFMERARRVGAFFAAGSVIAAGLVGVAPAQAAVLPTPAPVEDRSASQVSADTLPTVQIDNGVVWNQAIAGNTVFAGGDFWNTRPAGATPGQNLTRRANVLAYDITTGNLLPFAPEVNGVVRTVEVSPDQSRLYIGGSFTSVNGQPRANIAAFDIATGQLLDTSSMRIGGTAVYAMAVTDTAVYVGGLFTQANGAARNNLAAFDLSGNLTSWAPRADRRVEDMLFAQNKLIIAGRFGYVNMRWSPGTASLDPATGTTLPWELNKNASSGIINGGSSSDNTGTMGLSVEGGTLYGAGWQHNAGSYANIEGPWAADLATGRLSWMTAGSGDHYDVTAVNGTAYAVGHSHNATPYGGWSDYQTPSGEHQFSIAVTGDARGTNTSGGYWNNAGKLAPAIKQWYPKWINGTYTKMYQAAWSIESNKDYVIAGGEFIGVNGQYQQGLARFTRSDVTKSTSGPRMKGDAASAADRWETPSFTARPGGARISIRPNFDRDNRVLTYELYRSGVKTPVARTTFASDHWTRTSQLVTLTDLTGSGSTSYTYQVKAVDSDGNSALSAPVTGTTGAGSNQPANRYSDAVMLDGPSIFWRLGGDRSAAGIDWAGNTDASVGTSVVPANSGAVLGDSGTGSWLNGTSGSRIGTSGTVLSPTNFSTEVWFKTTTTTGGKIMGYGNSAAGASSRNDRHVYMSNDGKLTFGIYNGAARTVTSAASYNDNQWHHVVSSLDASGMKLYVDGQIIGQDASVTSSSDVHNGYWRLGGDTVIGWPLAPSTSDFKGDLDEFAVYPFALSPQQVAAHYSTARDGSAVPPQATFTTAVDQMRVSFDASGSTAFAPKTIKSYRWDFGDGSTGLGVNPSHSYAKAGQYSVTLTLQDSAGLSTVFRKDLKLNTPYSARVLADGASGYWGLGVDGKALTDQAGTNDLSLGSGVTTNPDARVASNVPGSMTFSGNNLSLPSKSSTSLKVSDFSQEAWFRTTTTRGGLIFGNSGSSSGTGGAGDRLLSMNNSGQLHYYVWPGIGRSVVSPKTYNDGQWHHVVVTVGTAGAELYVDGVRVAVNSAATSAENRSGYWRVGNGPVYSSTVSSYSFAGDIDEVAVYSKALSATQVTAHYDLGLAALPEPQPEPAPAPGTPLVTDTFSVDSPSWGTTAEGYEWAADKGLSVANGSGSITLPTAGQSRSAWLRDAAIQNLDLTVDASFTKASAGGSSFLSTAVRHTDSGDYRVKLVLGTNQTLTLNLERLVGNTATVLASAPVKGLTYTPGQTLQIRVSAVTTDGTTALQAKVWSADAQQPDAWTVTASDATAALAGPGTIGLIGYLGGASTIAPQTVMVDNLRVVAP